MSFDCGVDAQVFPTRVGVNRLDGTILGEIIGFPHPRGGEPVMPWDLGNHQVSFPHPRGGEPSHKNGPVQALYRFPHPRGGEP